MQLHLLSFEEQTARHGGLAGQTPFIDKELDRLTPMNRLMDFISDVPGELLVAELNGEVVAHGGFHLYRRVRDAFIFDLVVDPAHRGQGIGDLLLTTLEERAAKRGATLVKTGTWPENHAVLQHIEKSGYSLSAQPSKEGEDGVFVVGSKQIAPIQMPVFERVFWKILPYAIVLATALGVIYLGAD